MIKSKWIESKLSIKEVYEIHKKWRHETPYDKVFCDGYLFANNYFYKNIRNASIELGIKFSDDRHPNYLIQPLATVTDILNSKTVPLINNAQIFELAAKKSNVNLLLRDFPDFTRNKIMHESCHVIANELFNQIKNLKIEKTQKKVLNSLLGESFANTVDKIGYLYLESEIEKILFSLNSYMPIDESSNDIIKLLISKYNFKYVFKFLLISFLFSNFLYEKISKKGVILIVKKITGISKEVLLIDELEKLFSMGFSLNKGFKISTNQYFFRSIGIDMPIKDIVNFNFLEIILNNDILLKFIDSLAEITINGKCKEVNIQDKLVEFTTSY